MPEPSENHQQSVSLESVDLRFRSGQLVFGFLASDERKRTGGRKPRFGNCLPGEEKTPHTPVAETRTHPPMWNLTTKPSKWLSNEDIAFTIELVYLSVTSGNGDLFRARAYREASNVVRAYPDSVVELLLQKGPSRLGEKLGLKTHFVVIIEEIVHSSLGCCLHPLSDKDATKGLPVGLLLAIDARYRVLARLGQLSRVAPRRFNPEQKAWLPVMDTEIEGLWLRTMYSNSEQARQLARVTDWVVIVASREGHVFRYTVVTERYGTLSSLRVVRGHEPACRDYYRRLLSKSPNKSEGPNPKAA